MIYAATWLDGDRGFLLSGYAGHGDQVVRFDGSRRDVVWSSPTQMVTALGTSVDGREVRVSTQAWNWSFGLLEAR